MPGNILILGGSGFVGSYLKDHLRRKYRVTTSSLRGTDTDLAFDITKDKNHRILADFDCVVNCCVRYSESINGCFDVNVGGTRNVVAQLVNSNSHYINISSISAVDENYQQNAYSLTKRISDELVEFCGVHEGLKATTLRFSQIYDAAGKARKSQPGIYYFAEKMKISEALTIFGDKRQLRSYIPVEVLCQCVQQVIESGITGSHNVIMKDTYTPFELAQVFAGLANNSMGSIVFDEQRASNKYFIPGASDVFKDLLSDTDNLPYFKALFENV